MIAGNWKMHLDAKEAGELALAIKKGLDPDLEHEVLVAPTYTNLWAVRQADKVRRGNRRRPYDGQSNN